MSKHIANVGDKITAEVTVANIYEHFSYAFSYDGTTTYIYTMEDASGNVLVWKTSICMGVQIGNGCYSIHKNDVIKITGKVKEHSEYKGTAQTVLTRCKYELVKRTPSKEELDALEAQRQRDSLVGDDFIWKMPYKQFKEHYADCETIKGSYEFDPIKGSSIEVIIREGRLKNNGVRGMHFAGYQFKADDGTLVCYRAVSEENARKQMAREYPNSSDWECTQIFRYALREYY